MVAGGVGVFVGVVDVIQWKERKRKAQTSRRVLCSCRLASKHNCVQSLNISADADGSILGFRFKAIMLDAGKAIERNGESRRGLEVVALVVLVVSCRGLDDDGEKERRSKTVAGYIPREKRLRASHGLRD